MKRIDDLSPMKKVSHDTAPMVLRTTSSATRNGNARKRSVTRITTSSKRPPRNPATAPMTHPKATEMIALKNPMINETRIP